VTFAANDLKSIMEGEFSESLILETPSHEITFDGFFETTFLMIDSETGMPVLSKNPRASFYEDEIVAVTGPIEEGWFITARGIKYRIKSPQPDGEGLCVVELKNAQAD
jgi:hypothetical protein